jgi:hypothetical protein
MTKVPAPPPPPPRPDPLTGQRYEKREWLVISRWALWMCGLLTFVAGLVVGFAFGILVMLNA